jgi:DNA helicase II / ATP-dependent DNA helicase PcrA
VPKLGDKDKLTVGTYHAVASILLREEAKAFGLYDHTFSTIDESEAQSIWKSALKQCGHDQKSALFVPGRLHALYSLARNTAADVVETFRPQFKGNAKRMTKVVEVYEELKRAANVVDYDDLLILWEQRLGRDPDYATRLRARWPYVLVDEMQDNNRLNAGILEKLQPEHLMVVGDANQSIYGFRGSDVSLINEFAAKNPGTAILKLEDNYRSGQAILDLANRIVEKSAAALKLRSSGEKPGQVKYRMYLNPDDEAYAIVQWIQDRMLAGKKGEDNAILARSSRALTPLELSLNFHRIRYKKYGGLMLADAAEVKDFICFLRVSHNGRDKIALLRALTQFPGIGEGTAARAIASHEGNLFGEDEWPAAAAELPLWIEEIRGLHELGSKGKFLEEKIKPLIMANYPKDAEERLGTIRALVTAMENAKVPLAEFLDGFTLSRATNDFHPEEAVILSTVHSSKGLEWDGVWVVGAGSAQIPHPRVEDGETAAKCHAVCARRSGLGVHGWVMKK